MSSWFGFIPPKLRRVPVSPSPSPSAGVARVPSRTASRSGWLLLGGLGLVAGVLAGVVEDVAWAKPVARLHRRGRKAVPVVMTTIEVSPRAPSASPGQKTTANPRAPLVEGSVQAAARAESVVVIDTAAIEAEVRRHRGHPVILHFWASWCGPCLTELPLVNELAETLRGSGADVLSISLDDPEKRADQVLSVLKAQAPALTAAVARIDDPDRFIAAFHGMPGQPWEGSIPALFAFDRKGALIRQHVGEASAGDLLALARGAGVKNPRAHAATRKLRPR